MSLKRGPAHSKSRFSLAPLRVPGISPRARKLYHSLNWLLDRQNDDGSWGGKELLDRNQATTQVVMTALAAGIPGDDAQLHRAVAWLLSEELSTYDWSFWRVGPLAGLPEYERYLEADVRRLNDRIAGLASPHPEQSLEAFYVILMESLGKAETDPQVKVFRERLVSNWTDNGWHGRADSTTNVLSALIEFGFSQKDEFVEQTKRLLRKWAHKGDSSNRIYWVGRVQRTPGGVLECRNVSTAYVLINLIEIGIEDDAQVADLVAGAVGWLWDQRCDDGSWPVELTPYGGHADIKTPFYFTAAILRALIAYEMSVNPNVLLEIAALRAQGASSDALATPDENRKFIRNTRKWKIFAASGYSLLIIFIMFFFWDNLTSYMALAFSWFWNIAEKLGPLGALASIGGFMLTVWWMARRLSR